MSEKKWVDHLGRTVTIPFPPMRIISLCPSITETLFALQLPGEVVGRTRFCVHPVGKVEGVQTVGGTKKINMELIQEIQPDLIIAEKEENPKAMIEALERMFPVYVVNVENTRDAFQMIEDLGAVCGNEKEGIGLSQAIKEAWINLPKLNHFYKAAYLIWRKPYMAVGNHTYIHSVLETLGFTNVFSHYADRYPEVSIEDFRKERPDTILLSSEPFPFTHVHIGEIQEKYSDAKIVFADGEMFSWYGSRMLLAADYFKEWIKRFQAN